MKRGCSVKKLVAAILAVVGFAASASAQRVSEASIQAAIKCGMKEIKCDEPVLYPSGFRVDRLHFDFSVLPPAGRIFLAAREAKEKHLKFARDDVTDEMLAPTIQVRARDAHDDNKSITNITQLLILPRGQREGAIQPIKSEDWNHETKNLVGASFFRIGKSAYFAVSELPAGELDFVIISDLYGEVRGGIGKTDREKLDQWCGLGVAVKVP